MGTLTFVLEWILGDNLSSLLTAVAILYGAFKVPKALHDEKRAGALKDAIKFMFPAYMASEEGIVWGDYPKDKERVVAGVARKIGVDEPIIRGILDELQGEGSI